MAVTITPGEVAVAIRAATDANQVPEAVSTVMGFLVTAAVAMVEEHAPEAPEAVANAAVIRIAGFLYDSDPAQAGGQEPMRQSGASALLSQWRIHRVGPVSGVAGEPLPPSGSGLPPLPPAGTYILQSVDGVLTWIEFPAPS